MIKGVNHRVIEINRPESVYFERAVLYLKPEVNEVPLQAARLETEAYLGGTSRKKRRLRGWVWFVLGMLASGAGGALLMVFQNGNAFSQ